MFYGRIKNLKGKELEEQVEHVLRKVNLWDVRDKVSSKYSGGMKRRLSVAISIMGFPKVIYLDEPSTVKCIVYSLKSLGPRSKEQTGFVASY